MERVEVSVHVDRPVEEVFAYMGDPANAPEWNSSIESAAPSESPLRVGTKVRLRQKFLGRTIDPTLEITEYVPNSRLAYSFDKPIKGTGTETYESEDGGTRVTQVFEVEAGRFFKVAEPIAARVAKRQFQASLETMMEIVQARQPVQS